MLDHAGQLDDAAQLHLAPPAAGLRRPQRVTSEEVCVAQLPRRLPARSRPARSARRRPTTRARSSSRRCVSTLPSASRSGATVTRDVLASAPVEVAARRARSAVARAGRRPARAADGRAEPEAHGGRGPQAWAPSQPRPADAPTSGQIRQQQRDAHGPSVAAGVRRLRGGCTAVPLNPVSLTIGIVGLPNVGKSHAVQRPDQERRARGELPVRHDRAQRRRRRRARPAAGRAGRDLRLGQSILPATVSFVDIAGIVRGASRGARGWATSSSPTSARATRSAR